MGQYSFLMLSKYMDIHGSCGSAPGQPPSSHGAGKHLCRHSDGQSPAELPRSPPSLCPAEGRRAPAPGARREGDASGPVSKPQVPGALRYPGRVLSHLSGERSDRTSGAVAVI